MAEFLGISYAKVALAAAIPALLYYLALYFILDFEAARQGWTKAAIKESLNISRPRLQWIGFFHLFPGFNLSLFHVYSRQHPLYLCPMVLSCHHRHRTMISKNRGDP